MSKKDEFIKKAESVHGKGTYDYSDVHEYQTGREFVKIKCNECGNVFSQRASCHLQGQGCPICGEKKGRDKLKQVGRNNWYKRATERWKDKIDFLNAYNEYDGNKSKVTVKCKDCGNIFTINVKQLDRDRTKIPCPKCYKEDLRQKAIKLAKTNKKFAKGCLSTTEEFIKKAEKVHGKGEYDYSKVDYKGIDVPVLIIDPKRNNEEFWQRPGTHLQGKGNPNRRQSEGEVLVSRWLRENSIEFSSEVTVRNIEGRKGAESLVRIDFCLVYNEKTYWIEYNGEQHYKFKRDILIGRRKTPEEQLEHFNQQVSRDKNVKNYCQQNSIIFIEIPYTYDTYNKISEVLSKIILNDLKPDEVLVIPEIDYELTEQQKEKYGTVNNQVEVENNETQNIESNDDNS